MEKLQRQILISIAIVLLESTCLECLAQYVGNPYYGSSGNPYYSSSGNQHYSNQNYGSPSYQSYGSGFGGRVNNRSFNGGFSGLDARSQPMPQAQSPPASAQIPNTSTMASLEQSLNAIDTNRAWSRTPVGGLARPQLQQPQAAAPGAVANSGQGMFPGISRREMLRVFLGGSPQPSGFGSGASSPSGNSSANTSTAYSNYQTATNEATKARNDANRARYDRDKWNRKNAAEQAEYAANNAEYAAQRAESAAYSGDSQACSYAGMARDAANRARANANQARYNADTIQ